LRAPPRLQPTWCRVDARLTAPATARYRQIFPADVEALSATGLPFTWKFSAASCEVMPLHRTPLEVNYQGFLDTALCLLVQTHYVNSPFTALTPVALESRERRTFIRTGAAPDLGVYLDADTFRVETQTQARGRLTVDYEQVAGAWVPSRLAQRLGPTQIVVDQLEYDGAHAGRLKAFVINVGEDKVRPHSDVTISECQSY